MPNNPTNLFTNAHSHIFTVSDAPDYFLKTAIKSKWLAELVDKMLQKKGTRAVLQAIHWIIKPFSPNYRNTVERYIEFVEIGTSATQQEILDKESQAYSKVGTYRIVALTQVLDYLDYNQTSNHKKIQTQVEEVANLKRNALYQDRLYPFLGIDPRMQGTDLLQWVKKYVSKDYGFYGIKIYPAYGFFPFDNRLAPVWEWAAGEGIPVMSHSTRGGSFYLGNFSSILNSGGFVPQSLNPNSATMPAIKDRINSLVKDGSVQKNNKVWCNIFGHIDNYRVVLEDNRFKNLKICLAHLGGSDEVNRSIPGKGPKPDYPDYLGPNWYTEIKKLMAEYPNVYSDISYTLSDDDAMGIITAEFIGHPLMNRLMYGTDFYLTQQEAKGDEPNLINQFFKYFKDPEIRLLAYQNPHEFLRSNIHPEG